MDALAEAAEVHAQGIEHDGPAAENADGEVILETLGAKLHRERLTVGPGV
jgi:hypothetical protein